MEKTLEKRETCGKSDCGIQKKNTRDADCTLDYNEAWKLLVSVRLAGSVYRRQSQCGRSRISTKSFRM